MRYIKLDYDFKTIPTTRISKVINFLHLDIIDIFYRKTKNGHHVQLTARNKLTDYDIVCIQSLMLSDFNREMYNLLRVKSGKFKNRSWNILFKEKIIFQIPVNYMEHFC